MGMKKWICLAGLMCTQAVQLVYGQGPQRAQVPGPGGPDPFTLTIGSSFSASGSAAKPPGGGSIRKETIAADVDEAISVIRRNHASSGSFKPEVLTESAIGSMLKALDPHSNYYNPSEFQELLGEHESEYSGTGSSIAGFEQDGQINTFILSTFPDSPAAKAGLRFGDKIIAVDGRLVAGESPDLVRDLVRGKRGTSVHLLIERAGDGSRATVEMRRDRVHEPAVPQGFLINGSVGYVDLTSGFSNSTFGELESAMSELRRQGMTSMVLDLRGNGGGILEQAVKVAEKFLPAGSTIVSQRGRYSNDERTWRAGKSRFESMPLVLLVDENTASASEVLAGALQDNDRALVVGQKTFGKGLVQSVLNLPEGAGLTLTAARYYTPTGRSIQRDYTDTGLYDYFNHRGGPVSIDKSSYAARTVTNRVVYGGDGISPDQKAEVDAMTPAQLRLLDPIFYFSREYLNGRVAAEDLSPENAGQTIRQRVIFREQIVDERLVGQFLEFTAGHPEWSSMRLGAAKDREFVRKMMRYYLTMGVFGLASAKRADIESDPQVIQAVNALPQAARLWAAAEKARNMPKKQKSSLSLVLSERR